MIVTNMTSFKEEKEKKRILARKQFKRTRIRSLGGKVYYAMKRQYHCDRCIFPIDYLEQYLLERFVRDYYNKEGVKTGTRFWYERSHWPQCYGPSEEEDREIREQIERECEAERKNADRKVA